MHVVVLSHSLVVEQNKYFIMFNYLAGDIFLRENNNYFCGKSVLDQI